MTVTNLDIVKTTLYWKAAGFGMALNVFNAILTQPTPHTISDADLNTDMEHWMEDIITPLLPDIVVDYEVIGITTHKWAAPHWEYVIGGLPVLVGTNGGEALPSGVAALMGCMTSGARTLGKKYIPGMSELVCSAGVWGATVLGHMATAAVQWTSPFASVDSGSTWYPGAFSLILGGLKAFNTRIWIPDIPAYQRRRKENVGI